MTLYGGAIQYGQGKLCLPCLVYQLPDEKIALAIQHKLITQVARGTCSQSETLSGIRVDQGRIYFTSTTHDGENHSAVFDFENPQLSAAEKNWGPVCKPTLDRLGNEQGTSSYVELKGRSSDWNTDTRLRLVSIPKKGNEALYEALPVDAEIETIKAKLKVILTETFAHDYIQGALAEMSAIKGTKKKGSTVLPPGLRRGHMKYVAMLALHIRGTGFMPGGRKVMAPQHMRQVLEPEESSVKNVLAGAKKPPKFCALEVMNEDVLWQVFTFLSGLRTPGFVYTGSHSWGGSWHGGAMLYFVEQLGEDIHTIVIQPMANGATVSGAQWSKDSKNTWKLEWGSADNSDATRRTKPHRASLVFSADFQGFEGDCNFPGEGSIGWGGCTTTAALKSKYRVSGAPLDAEFD